MQFKHTPAATASSFDDPNLVSHAGLIPVMRLAERAGLQKLAQRWLSVPTDRDANARAKIFALVAGMVAGADSIDDLGVLRHGGMRKFFSRVYAPSTLGSFLRAFSFGHVRQLDAIASRFLTNLSRAAAGLVAPASGEFVMVDVDDSIVEVHGYQKQGAGYGYSGVRGVNMRLGTASTSQSAPVVVAQRLRKGPHTRPKGLHVSLLTRSSPHAEVSHTTAHQFFCVPTQHITGMMGCTRHARPALGCRSQHG